MTEAQKAVAAPAQGESSGARPSYEQAREELLEVVRRLEQGGTTLEESLSLWERAEELAALCQEWLEGARRRLDETIASQDRSRVSAES